MGFTREEGFTENTAAKTKNNTKSTEEMESTAMATTTIGLVLLIAAAKHAFTSLSKQWRLLSVFFLLNLLLMAILFTSSLTSNSNEKKKKKKKIKHKKKQQVHEHVTKKHGKMSSKKTSTASSCSSNNSWYLSSVQAVEDYFCKISEAEQQEIDRSSHERKNDFDACESTVNDRNNTHNNLSSASSKEDINARVEAFIVMFRQQLAMDALQQSGRRQANTPVRKSRNGEYVPEVAHQVALAG